MTNRIITHSKPLVSQADINAVANQTLSGMHATGSQTKNFETQFAYLMGTKHAKASSSGTTALHLSLVSLDITEKDEVIIPSYVCQAILNAVNYTGASSIPVDLDPDFLEKGYNISATTIKDSITKNTKAIIVPHMFGEPAELSDILDFGLPVIEDCAQSLGASYDNVKTGSLGIIGMFSFYATKVISTGQGGMITTKSDKIKEKLEDLTKYDQRKKYGVAYNYGLTDIQSALGISQLDRLSEFLERRQYIAKSYDEAFIETSFKLPPRTEEGIPFRYVIQTSGLSERELLQKKLVEKGIISEQPIFKPLHQYLRQDPSKFKATEYAHNTALSIPIYPALTDDDVNYVIQSVLEVNHKLWDMGFFS